MRPVWKPFVCRVVALGAWALGCTYEVRVEHVDARNDAAVAPDTDVAARSDGANDAVLGVGPCAPFDDRGTDALWLRGDDLRDALGARSLVGTSLYVPIRFSPGVVGSAFDLTTFPIGTLALPAADAPRLRDAMSVELWVRPAAPGLFARLVDKISQGARDGYLLDLDGGVARFHMGGVSVLSQGALPAQAWTHLAATYDGAMMRLYVDGAPQADTRFHAPPVPDNPANDLRLGTSSTGYFRFTGQLDEVIVRGRSLRADEVRASFAAGAAGHCR